MHIRSCVFFFAFSFLSAVARAETLRDVRPPLALPWNPWFWYLLLGMVLIILIGAVWLLHRKLQARTPKTVSEPRPLPWELAEQRLQNLRQQNLPQQGRIQEYFFRLSDIVRRYIEERFRIRAPEMTTEEFLLSLQDAPELKVEQKQSLREFLNCCDRVKFARYGSDAHEMQTSFDMAHKLVQETKKPPGPVYGTNAGRDDKLK